MSLKKMINDFISLLFPNICAACGNALDKQETCICLHCVYHLPKTNYHLQKDNALEKIFWGRVQLFSAAAYYNFSKGSYVQNLIHQLKYKGKTEVGVVIGKMYGRELVQNDNFNTVNTIIAVPLHSKKKRKRGYNQSDFFAQGLSQAMNVETDVTSISRVHESDTQTKKTRYSRWKNVESIFKLTDDKTLIGKHVLLVDDVVTTGATIEACAQTLLQIKDVKLSIAAIAFASH